MRGHPTNGYTPVSRRGRWGVIDSRGKVRIKPCWDSISWVTVNGQAIVSSMGNYGVVDILGEMIIPLEWDYITFLQMNEKDNPVYALSKQVREVEDEVTLHNLNAFGPSYLPATECCANGVADSAGRYLLQPIYDRIQKHSSGYLILGKDCRQGVADLSGNILVDVCWERIKDIRDPYVSVIDSTYKNGIITLDNEVLFPMQYDELQLPYRDYVWFRKGTRWGILTMDGAVHIRPRWSNVNKCTHSDYYRANYNGGWGLLRYDGVVAVDFLWHDIRLASKGQAEVKKNKQWQFVPLNA